MDVPPIKDSISQRQELPLQVGNVVRVTNLKSIGEGGFSFDYNGKIYQGFLQNSQNLPNILSQNSVNINIISIEPHLEFIIIDNSTKYSGLNVGSKVSLEIVSAKDGIFNVIIGGKSYSAIIDPPPQFFRLMAEIIKTDTLLELKPIGVSSQDILFSALMKSGANFDFKEISAYAKLFSGTILSAFLSEDIKRVIKDGGNFLENKLLKGLSATGDAKLGAYSTDNQTSKELITKMQIANLLMRENFFTFFEGDNLDFENGMMRLHKTTNGGINLSVKLTFSNIGETVVSFVKTPTNSYYVTVRTERDLSEEISHINLPNCQINWRKLTEADKESFNIFKESLIKPCGFDMKI